MQALHALISTITSPIRALFTWFAQLVPALHTASKFSLPFRWSIIALLFLLILWCAAGIRLVMTKSLIWSWMRGDIRALVILTALLILIPILVYHLVRYLMMEDVSRFPDIDQAWKDAIKQSKDKGVSIADTPLFLVLGCTSFREVSNIAKQTGLEFVYSTASTGEPPLAVFTSRLGFFAFINGCNCMSRLSTSTKTTEAIAQTARNPIIPYVDAGATMDAGHLAALDSQTANALNDIDDGPGLPDVRSGGTMLLPEGQELSDFLQIPVMSPTSKALSSQDKLDCEERLRHLCNLIKNSRMPLCPINGIVSAIPFDLIESSSEQLQLAAQNDLRVLREELQVRCPNTVVVTGLEREEGFVELIRRLPPDKSQENRFGKGCDLWFAPEASRLDALAIHATSAFEDWIYMLFQENDAIRKKGNSRLFRLLCRARGVFSENLRKVLAGGFGYDPQHQPNLAHEQFLFGGCYFAAIGNMQSQQAFIKSVFSKVLQQEGELEWSPAARYSDRAYHFWANIAALVGLLAVIAIVAMVAARVYLSRS